MMEDHSHPTAVPAGTSSMAQASELQAMLANLQSVRAEVIAKSQALEQQGEALTAGLRLQAARLEELPREFSKLSNQAYEERKRGIALRARGREQDAQLGRLRLGAVEATARAGEACAQRQAVEQQLSKLSEVAVREDTEEVTRQREKNVAKKQELEQREAAVTTALEQQRQGDAGVLCDAEGMSTARHKVAALEEQWGTLLAENRRLRQALSTHSPDLYLAGDQGAVLVNNLPRRTKEEIRAVQEERDLLQKAVFEMGSKVAASGLLLANHKLGKPRPDTMARTSSGEGNSGDLMGHTNPKQTTSRKHAARFPGENQE